MSLRVTRYLVGAGSAALALGLVITAPAAQASTTISLKESQANTSWDAYSHEDCPQTPTSWVWHFVLPGGEATFDSLTVQFQNAGQVVKTSDWAQDGKGAYVTVPGADTVVSATAEIEGSTPQNDFVISHTCAGPTEGGTTTTGGGGSGTTTTTGSGGGSGTTTSGGGGGSGTATGGGGGGGTTTTSGGGGGGAVQTPTLGGGGVTAPATGGGTALPFTGQSTLQLGLVALAAIVAGGGLTVAARRRTHAQR